MLSINKLRQLNDPNIELDTKMQLLNNTDEVDNYLIKLIQRFKEKIEFDKYYLSYSGGKDSHLIYWIIKEILQDSTIKIVGINTFMEHHEILQRIMKNCDILLTPKLKPFEIKEKYGIPCFSKQQDEFIKRYQNGSRSKNTMNFVLGINPIFKLNTKAKNLLLKNKLHKISADCCKYLKKVTVHDFEKETGLKPILGVRGAEGMMRKRSYQTCLTKDNKFTPLWDLSDEMEDEIYKRYNIEIPKVYEYVQRTGCMGCPYSKKNVNNTENIESELSMLTDSQRKFVCKYFRESYDLLGVDTNKQYTIFDFIGGENE